MLRVTQRSAAEFTPRSPDSQARLLFIISHCPSAVQWKEDRRPEDYRKYSISYKKFSIPELVTYIYILAITRRKYDVKIDI